MTRKRFVKLMMGLGYSRNAANLLAIMARQNGQGYAARWGREKTSYYYRNFASSLLAGLQSPIESIAKAAAAFAAEVATAAQAAVKKIDAALAAACPYELAPADDEQEPAAMWPKENPHLHGLRTHVVLVDELAASDPPLTNEQVKATTAHWPGPAFRAGIDLANGPDVAAEITVAGGAENAH